MAHFIVELPDGSEQNITVPTGIQGYTYYKLIFRARGHYCNNSYMICMEHFWNTINDQRTVLMPLENGSYLIMRIYSKELRDTVTGRRLPFRLLSQLNRNTVEIPQAQNHLLFQRNNTFDIDRYIEFRENFSLARFILRNILSWSS